MAERIKFNDVIMKYMSLFNAITKTTLKDCVELPNKMLFIVPEGSVGKAIGKQASNVKKLEQKFKKRVKIIEYSPQEKQWVINVIYPNKVKDVTFDGKTCTIIPKDSYTRGQLIGRNAVNLREYETIIKRYADIDEVKVESIEQKAY